MGNPLVETSSARQYAAKITALSYISLLLIWYYILPPSDFGAILFLFIPVIGALIGFAGYYHYIYHWD
jgi:hypothetical protein